MITPNARRLLLTQLLRDRSEFQPNSPDYNSRVHGDFLGQSVDLRINSNTCNIAEGTVRSEGTLGQDRLSLQADYRVVQDGSDGWTTAASEQGRIGDLPVSYREATPDTPARLQLGEASLEYTRGLYATAEVRDELKAHGETELALLLNDRLSQGYEYVNWDQGKLQEPGRPDQDYRMLMFSGRPDSVQTELAVGDDWGSLSIRPRVWSGSLAGCPIHLDDER